MESTSQKEKRSFSFSKFVQSIRGNDSKYDKRYFKIDTQNGKFMYADDKKNLNKPSFEILFRDLLGVKRNVVSMPKNNKFVSPGPKDKLAQKTKESSPRNSLVEVDIFDKNSDVDRGPSGYPHVFEVKVTGKILTLYSNDKKLVDKFYTYIE